MILVEFRRWMGYWNYTLGAHFTTDREVLESPDLYATVTGMNSEQLVVVQTSIIFKYSHVWVQ